MAMSALPALPASSPMATRADRSFSSPAKMLRAMQELEDDGALEGGPGEAETGEKRARPALQRFDTRAMLKEVVTDPEAEFTSLELEGIREKFKLFDEDGSGELSVEELDVAVRYMGYYPTTSMLQAATLAVDADGSGEIDFKEFLHLLLKLKRDDTPEEHLERCFVTLARDLELEKLHPDDQAGRDAVLAQPPEAYLYAELPVDSLAALLQACDEPLDDGEVSALLREADADGNGSVSLDELRRALLGSS